MLMGQRALKTLIFKIEIDNFLFNTSESLLNTFKADSLEREIITCTFRI